MPQVRSILRGCPLLKKNIKVVVSTQLKNISQNGNLPQINRDKNKKYLKPPSRSTFPETNSKFDPEKKKHRPQKAKSSTPTIEKFRVFLLLGSGRVSKVRSQVWLL